MGSAFLAFYDSRVLFRYRILTLQVLSLNIWTRQCEVPDRVTKDEHICLYIHPYPTLHLPSNIFNPTTPIRSLSVRYLLLLMNTKFRRHVEPSSKMPEVIPGVTHSAYVIGCICVLALYSNRCYHRITRVINDNFPSARLNARETQIIYDTVCAERPEWIRPLDQVGPMDPIVQASLRLLERRAIRGRIMPLEMESYEGPLFGLHRLLNESGFHQ